MRPLHFTVLRLSRRNPSRSGLAGRRNPRARAAVVVETVLVMIVLLTFLAVSWRLLRLHGSNQKAYFEAHRRTFLGVTSFIAFASLRVPYALPLAILAAVGELIPLIGPTIGAIPALAMALLHSRWQFWSVLAFAVVLQKAENLFIVPRVMSKKVSLSPLAVVIAFMVGASLLGVLAANRHRSLPQSLFEVGYVVEPDGKGRWPNRLHLAGVQLSAKAGFSDAKGLVLALLRDLKLDAKLAPAERKGLVAGRQGRILKAGHEVGWFGELHPDTLVAFGLPAPCIAFELDLAAFVRTKD